jgi:protein TonB
MERSREDRAKAAAGAALCHALLGYALITGLGYQPATILGQPLRVFDLRVEPPPPPVPESVPAQAKTKAAEGAASPPSLKAKPTPVVAPPPKVRIEAPPRVTVPEPKPLPPGTDPRAGASPLDGAGSGAGGVGAGAGSGGRGDGAGGGMASRAQRERGSLENQDYPRAALRAGAQGSVKVRFTVGSDGRVSGCRVTRSSGREDLDSTTCRLIEQRFVYRPARDAQGRPVAELVSKTYDWLLPAQAYSRR